MSPTSCRCSTPRHEERMRGPARSRAGGAEVPAAASPPTGSPPQYSPALPWVTTGFGMGPGGARTLSATDTSAPHAPGFVRASDGGRRLPRGNGAFPRAPGHTTGRDRDPPSAMSTGRLRSVTGRPPPASLPGRLPGAFLFSDGESRLGAGFPLRCFQRFAHPDVATQRCRLPDNWLTSGPSSPVLSY
jgi:hypothetical protein